MHNTRGHAFERNLCTARAVKQIMYQQIMYARKGILTCPLRARREHFPTEPNCGPRRSGAPKATRPFLWGGYPPPHLHVTDATLLDIFEIWPCGHPALWQAGPFAAGRGGARERCPVFRDTARCEQRIDQGISKTSTPKMIRASAPGMHQTLIRNCSGSKPTFSNYIR